MRGMPSTANAIFKKAKVISETKHPLDTPSRPKVAQGGGAYNSIQAKKSRTTQDSKGNIISQGFYGSETPQPIKENLTVSNYFDSLQESLALLNETKEYSSVVRGLLTYYLAGKLDKNILEGLDFEDKLEIMGIIKDFEYSVKNFMK